MGSEKSDEDIELPQATERVIPLESERAKMLSVGPDAKAQAVTVPEEKCLPTALLISADQMCEEKEERSVDVIKETAKEDINPLVLNSWQVQRGVGKPTRKLPFIQRNVVMRKRSTMRKKVRLKSRRSNIDSQKYRKSVLNGEQPFMEI
ncbi:splicing factor 3B subunit 2 [Trichonephila clavipes]|nr:splicing factor 3B subunit 2 [Trichonephila clavipes]